MIMVMKTDINMFKYLVSLTDTIIFGNPYYQPQIRNYIDT